MQGEACAAPPQWDYVSVFFRADTYPHLGGGPARPELDPKLPPLRREDQRWVIIAERSAPMPPFMLNIVAACSGAGKTTLIEKLLPELAGLGLRVAALKGNIHHYELDLPGKDTWRYVQAGAEVAGMLTPEQYILIGRDRSAGGLTAAAGLLRNLDLLLIEGDKQSPNPKVEVVRKAVIQAPAVKNNVVAVATDVPGLEAAVPVFSLEDYRGLARFIHARCLAAGRTRAGEELTHFDRAGRPRLVDVSSKEQTVREAYARGEIAMGSATLARVREGSLAKGDVLGAAQVAAVMAVKETGRLIPMCHPLNVSAAEVDFTLNDSRNTVEIGVRVKLTGQTGVEMEALTGVSVAALTIYDMCKAVDKNMVIQNIRLVEKRGGRSGYFRREE